VSLRNRRYSGVEVDESREKEDRSSMVPGPQEHPGSIMPQTSPDLDLLIPPSPHEYNEAVLMVLSHIKTLMTSSQAETFTELLKEAFPGEVQLNLYGPDFDLTNEVNTQLAIVNAMRNTIVVPGTHALREGVTTREAKELISASNTLMSTLMKSHKDIINAERQRAVEEAVIVYASRLEDGEKSKFLDGLAEELEKLE